jgi:Autotransporter beta-domain/Putative Ig domain/Cadherin-like domain
MSDNNTHIDRGVFYTSFAFLTASGGTAPYSFNVTAGLPSGIAVNSDGTVSGVTCGTNGNFALTADVTDNVGGTGSSTTLKLIVNAAPAGGCSLTFSSSTVPNGNVGTAYSTTISATGGTAPYTYTVASGSLPTGLTLSSTGVISGTPSVAGTYSFTTLATDSGGSTGAQSYSMTITSGGTPPVAGAVSATVGYNSGGSSATPITLSLSGGAATSVAVASAASHGTATASGTTISYTPTANYIGSDSFTYTATNSSGTSSPATVSITISAPTVTISPSTLAAGTTGTAYSQTISSSGGFAPYTYAVSSGSLPTSLSLASNGTLSGTPTAVGTFNFTVSATDSSTGTHATGSLSYSVTIGAAPVAAPVSQTISYNSGSASATTITLSLSGGAATSVAVASAASHGTATASGTTISYTPTANYIGSDSFTYTATNSSGTSSPATVSITVSAPTVTISPSTVPSSTVSTPYSQSISASGGFAPYSYAITSGSLPTGMSLATNGTLSGTATVSGTFNFTVTVTDSSSGTPANGSRSYSLVVNAAVPAAPVAGASSQTVPYNAGSALPTTITLNLSGGTAASVAVASPASHGTVTAIGTTLTYTPTANYLGSDSFTYTATNTGGTSSPATVSITIPAPTISVSPTSLPAATISASYSQSISASGGLAPYIYTVSAGSLPAGLTLASSGSLSGTPTASGTFNFTITATDSSTGAAATGARAYGFTVNPVNPAAPVAGAASQNVSYNVGSASATVITLNLTGGAPTSVAVASAAAHGTATASGVTITYTPAPHYSGTDSFTYTATNSGGTSAAATVSVTISGPTLAVSPSSLPTATVATTYSQTILASGGLAPYTYTVSAGALPSGITLTSSGAISGTPTSAGTYNFTVSVTDSGSGTPATVSKAFTLAVVAALPAPPVATSTSQAATFNSGNGVQTSIALNLTGGTATSVTITTPPSHGTVTISGTSVTYAPNPNYVGTDSFSYTATNAGGTSAPSTVTLTIAAPPLAATPVNTAVTLTEYTPNTPFTPVTATGGVSPLKFSVSPTLPTGLTLDTTTGQITGSPTVSSADTSYTMSVTDATGQTKQVTFRLAVRAPAVLVTITPATLPNARQASNYSITFVASGGTGPYTWSITSGQLPSGLTLTSAGVLSGKPAAGSTFTITATDANGAVGTRTYTFSVDMRPNPTADPGVRGQVTAQAEMAKHFAMAQIENVTSHLREMQGGFDPCVHRGSITLDQSSPDPVSLKNREVEGTRPARSTEHEKTADTALDDNGSAAGSSDDGKSSRGGTSADKSKQEESDQCFNKALFGTDSIAFWSGGSLEHGSMDVDGTGRNYISTSGVTIGIDDELSHRFLLGLALGRGWARTRVDAFGTSTHGSSTSGVLSLSFRQSKLLSFDALVGYGHLSTSNTRWVSVDSTLVSGGRGGSNLFASLGATSILEARGFHFEPYLRADYIDSKVDGYREVGTTDLALTYSPSSSHSESFTAGFSMLHDFALSPRNTLTPLFSIQQQRTMNATQAQRLYYSDMGPDNSYVMSATAFPHNLTTGEIGFRLRNRGGIEGSLGMNYSIGSESFMSKTYRASIHTAF